MKRFIAVHRKPSSLPSVRFTIHTHGGSVRSHVQPGGCILLSFIKTNTKSDLICIGRSTKSVSLRLISDNTGVYCLPSDLHAKSVIYKSTFLHEIPISSKNGFYFDINKSSGFLLVQSIESYVTE